MRAVIWVKVYPTEDEELVRKAVVSVFPDAVLEREGNVIRGEARDLDRFREVIRSRRVRDTVEDILRNNYSSGQTWIDLNKQDALRGIVNVCEDSPLGCIHVEFKVSRDGIKDLVWGSFDGSRGEIQG